MEEHTGLQKIINGQTFITALSDKKIFIYKKGKVNCVNLFISDGAVYAASIREDSPAIGTAIITNARMLGGREIRPTDKIKITQVLPTAVIGEILEVYSS